MVRFINWFLVLIILSIPKVSLACATCFGAPESPQTQGLKFAMFTLLGVTGTVLSGFGVFFIVLMKKARKAIKETNIRKSSTQLERFKGNGQARK